MEQGENPSASGGEPLDYDSLCQKIRLAMEPVRAQAVSLHDETGDLLWLTESSMGPDEHNAVQQAFESFASGSGPTAVAYDLGDSRSAVLFRVTNAKRAMVGAVMVIVDTRALSQGDRSAGQLLTQKLLRALGGFAVMRRRLEPAAPPASPRAAPPAPPRAATPTRTSAPTPAPTPASKPASAPALKAAPPSLASVKSAAKAPVSPPAAPPPKAVAPISHDVDLSELTLTPMSEISLPPKASKEPAPASVPPPTASPAPRPSPSGTAQPAPAAPPSPSRIPVSSLAAPAPVTRITTPENTPPEVDRLNAALRNAPIALYVQRLMPLTKGSKMKRFEVLLRSKGHESSGAAQAMLKAAVDHGLGSMVDRRVITELVAWIVRHPRVCADDDVRFSVNLTKTALHDDHFMKFVSMCLAKAALPTQTVAFEIDVELAIAAGMRITEVAAGLHRLGCPLVLDDFALRTECFELLRLPGVKYIKLAPTITAQMRTDKVSQAAITALVQMARVLGLHTVAKRTESGAEQEWMTALGVDFIQSNALSPPVPIESLVEPANLRQAP
jgi:EAL domain-containing protein (putative c-di-GMP-specific phosphodiesterase class I)